MRAGAGYNTIDVAAASKRGIYVSNCPGKNAIAVAELAFALMLALDRRVPDNVADLRAGRWNKKEYSKAQGLFGKTLGLLGVGNIGQEMIRRAAGFGLNVVIWSRRFDGQRRPLTDQEARELGVEAALRQIAIEIEPTPADVAARADILSVHLALGPETKGLVNAERARKTEARGDPHQHGARRSGGRGRGCGSGARARAAGRPRCVRTGAGRRDR